MKKNKKGFTLVELLAVIVVLIIVLLIAIARIRESKKRANEKAIEANALSYIKTINDRASVSVLEDKIFKSGLFSVDGLVQAGVKVSGKAPDTGLFCVNNYAVTNACLTYDDAQVIYNNGKVVSIKKGTCDSLSVISCSLSPLQEFVYTGMYETFTAPSSGVYGIELWGAQGGGSNANPGGKGGYTSGIISLNAGDVLYFYVGEKGKSDYTTSNIGSFNGGGYSGSNAGTYSFGGGGATDVRLVSGEWNNTNSLRSRIMVAGGGGGNVDGSSYTNVAGVGGNLTGGSAQGTYNSTVPTGGTQTGPGAAYQDARKGIFGSGRQAVTDGWGGGGGGGFWGGSNGHGFAGSGGSSYISGHVGSVAIANGGTNNAKTGCANGTNDIKCSYHYTGNYFSNTIMKSGSESMPSHDGTTTMVGNEGNGYAKIFKYNLDEPIPYSSTVETFAYTGIKQVYNAPKSGNYMLEVWGAQGGSAAQSGYTTITGAYGGYSKGTIHLNKGDKLYVYVGGAGAVNSVEQGSVQTGGFNGGGVNSSNQWGIGATGGGATHIAKVSGVLSKLSNDIDSIIIVAGGGGAGGIETAGSGRKSYGGNGGGYIGNNASSPNCPDSPGVGGTQTTGAGFGQGSTSGGGWYGSAGGGFYGGTNGCGGGGGSGYIGNPLLTNKAMYCYNCSEIDEESTKTISVTCAQEQPTENCSKIGNGSAKISFID